MPTPLKPRPELHLIMFKRRGGYFMAACRGASKGCNVMAKQRQKLGPCEDCIRCRNDETLGEIVDRISRGDA